MPERAGKAPRPGKNTARTSRSSLSNLPHFPSSVFAVAGFPQLILTAAGWSVTSACGGEAQSPGVALEGTLLGSLAGPGGTLNLSCRRQ